MKNNIKRFPNYHWDGVNVWNIRKNRTVKQTYSRNSTYKFVKMKSFEGKWDSVELNTVEYLSGRWDVPSDYCVIPYTEGRAFINKEGRIYSTASVKYGVPLKPYHNDLDTSKYPKVTLHYKGKRRSMNIHQLMCVTFYDTNYVEKGLCCLHKDNDKSNYHLDNLKLGTYSENNKQAYDDGINPGNGFKR
ncbi:putative HNH endonuclease [Vibrio phage 277E43-1]|nr:putative HNH endonuclease [Vibrio phage 277E43-1]